MKKTIKQIEYNFAQLLFIVSLAKIKILEWGRGTGKSTILARFIIDCVTQMPRSSGALVASSYSQIKERTLPSTIAGLAQHGWYEGLHFFIGKKPPKSFKWVQPYESSLDYKNCIIFWNGTIIKFVSQDSSSTSGRGMNIDWAFGDEAALLDEKKFKEDIILANRGNEFRIADYPDGSWKYYKDCPMHHAITLASSTPVTLAGRWMLKYEQQAVISPDKVSFIRASAEVNRKNLGDQYFENARAILSSYMYAAEVENIRVPRIDNGFYPLLDEGKHTYNHHSYTDFLTTGDKQRTWKDDTDLDITQSLICGIDWGTAINTMVIAQGNARKLNFVNNIYVKSPKIVDDMIDEFIRYYDGYPTRELFMWYDPTGNIRTANSRATVADQVKNRLEKKGWSVYKMTQGSSNELHEHKHNLWNNILKEERPEIYPKIQFNKTNCTELWISMTNAPARKGLHDAIKKDKGSERSKKTPAEHATHFSDAADVIIVGMFNELMFGETNASVSAPILM